MVERMAREVPPEYLTGIAEVGVSSKTVPHPTMADVWTLGECIPIDPHTDPVQSRIVLYHGSFQALASGQPDFHWREEAWETLTHELRHHLEWLADAPDLEVYDWAADQNFRRHEGKPFDPLFFEAGEPLAPAVTRIDDDVFLDHALGARAWRSAGRQPHRFTWRGRTYEVEVPKDLAPVTYVLAEGVDEPPPGQLVVVLRRRPRVWDLFRRRPLQTVETTVAARRVEAMERR